MPRPRRTIETPADFHDAFERILAGESRLRRGHVELAEGGADVWLHVHDDVAVSSLFVRGLVLRGDGSLDGERHVHPVAWRANGLSAHQHNKHCGGFRLEGVDSFLPSALDQEPSLAMVKDRASPWDYAAEIVERLVDPAPAGDVMNPENRDALRWMQAIHATGVLLVDPFLQEAFRQQLDAAGE